MGCFIEPEVEKEDLIKYKGQIYGKFNKDGDLFLE